MLRRFAVGLMATALLAAACGDSIYDDGAGAPGASGELALRLQLAASLESFDDCDDVVAYFEDVTAGFEDVSAGLPGRASGPLGDVVVRDQVAGTAAPNPESASPVAANEAADLAGSSPGGLAATGGGASGEFSVTNIQEGGVDEPDLVKTDGEIMVTASQGRLFVIDPDGAGTRVLGSVALGSHGGEELFLHGDRVIVLARSSVDLPARSVEEGGAEIMLAPYAPTTVVTAVDLTDPSSPRIVGTSTFEGDYVSARLHRGVIRLVLTSFPTGGLPVSSLEDASPSDWLPNEIVGTGDDARAGDLLTPCTTVTHPPEPSGTGTVTVLTIDADGSTDPIDRDAVVADAQTVYSSTGTLYVATSQWGAGGTGPAEAAGAVTTEIHAFDVSDPGQTTYLASGRVRGTVLNQWSFSEHDGRLRVATTDTDVGTAGDRLVDEAPPTESFLTVLERNGDRLATVGQVGGLGRGETIHAVRYFGELGFVVTFRQVDPLYALDLSDPTAPRVLGELKVPGYSAYLHPVGDERLLGVGQNATDEGLRTGTQVSLFDVSDRAAMKRLDNLTIENSSSAVEWDAKAFLYWAQRSLAFVPIEVYGPPVPEPLRDPVAGSPAVDLAPQSQFIGLVAVRVDGSALREAGRITHGPRAGGPVAVPLPEPIPVEPGTAAPGIGGTDPAPLPAYTPSIQRAIVVGGSVYTVSDAGVMASDLGSFAEQAWAGF